MTQGAKNASVRCDESSLFVAGTVEPDASWPAAKVRAYERGLSHARKILEETGGALSLHEVTNRLGVSRQTVARMVKSGELFTVPGPSKRRRYPAIQFKSSGEIVPGLKQVVPALPTAHPYFLLNFLALPNDLAGEKRPIDLLVAGEVERVLSAARLFHEQGA